MRKGNVEFADVLISVIDERKHQNDKWGQQNHHPSAWLSILVEEVGELSQAINETVLDNRTKEEKGGYENMRAEAVQVAAVAIQFIEYLDRNYKEGEQS